MRLPVKVRRRRLGGAALVALLALAPGPGAASGGTTELLVGTTADAGPGSLRAALARAAAAPGRYLIRFDSRRGPFATPQTIALRSDLPPLRGDVTLDGYIEDRLWVPTGVTLSGEGRRRVLRVARGARVTLASLTIADGRAEQGAGVLNEGTLVVKGVTFVRNAAAREGGGLASLAGALTVVNSTFVANEAASGGGLALLGGAGTVTNCTFHRNRGRAGGGLFARPPVLLRNTVLANSASGKDCVAEAGVDRRSTHNAIVANQGCGTPLVTADPRLQAPGRYNGPTETVPLGGGSPAINMGDNASAVDEEGAPLYWDQRGNGDPRFVAGYTDIGAFEVQAFPVLTVNTAEDTGIRACTGAGSGDCSLRGAVELANAAKKPQVITFDPRVFATARVVTVAQRLPDVSGELTLDARGAGGITLRGPAPVLRAAAGGRLALHGVAIAPR